MTEPKTWSLKNVKWDLSAMDIITLAGMLAAFGIGYGKIDERLAAIERSQQQIEATKTVIPRLEERVAAGERADAQLRADITTALADIKVELREVRKAIAEDRRR